MKRINPIPEILLMSFFIMAVITSCQKEDNLTLASNFQSSERVAAICGSAESFDIIKKNQTDVLGSMTISNDQNNVYVSFNSPGGLNAIRLYYGDCNSIPSNQAHYGNLVLLQGQTSYMYTIPKSSVDSCACYAARVETNGVGLVIAEYCIEPCPECIILPGDYKTYGQGGYGSEIRGNNPGSYLSKNFDSAFPNGIEIGCNYKLTFMSAHAIRKFLPQGSSPASLSGNYTNPVAKMNVLAGQTLTLALNVGFDNYDSSFGNSTGNLQDLVITSGYFQGWSVSQILIEANNILGGCSSNFTASQINDIVTAINENFEDGTKAGELLTCP
jgi:hypothetical protein